jgi:hypothetical protein
MTAGDTAKMGNLAGPMIGNLLTLLTGVATIGFGFVALQAVLARRARVLARVNDRVARRFHAGDSE